MEISAEITQWMTNNIYGINTEVKVNVQRFEIVTSFKYVGLIITVEGSEHEMLSNCIHNSSTYKKPKWNASNINVSSKIRLM